MTNELIKQVGRRLISHVCGALVFGLLGEGTALSIKQSMGGARGGHCGGPSWGAFVGGPRGGPSRGALVGGPRGGSSHLMGSVGRGRRSPPPAPRPRNDSSSRWMGREEAHPLLPIQIG